MNETENILNSLNGMQRAQPAPGLYLRIQERMALKREDNLLAKVVGFIARPAVAAAAIVFIILLNVFAALSSFNAQDKAGTTLASNSSISGDYSAASAGLYNIEISEP